MTVLLLGAIPSTAPVNKLHLKDWIDSSHHLQLWCTVKFEIYS